MNVKPCEYCGADLPEGVDKSTRRIRSFHFSECAERPENVFEKERKRKYHLQQEAPLMYDLLVRLNETIQALEGTSVENEKLVDEYNALMFRVM
jgi:hypothetical protein